MAIRLNIWMSDELVDAIDAFRRTQRAPPNRAEAARILIAEALGKPALGVGPVGVRRADVMKKKAPSKRKH